MYNLHVVNKWLSMLNKWYVLSFLWQCVFFVVLAAIVNFAYDMESAISALLGGLAYCVPTLLANLYMNFSRRSSNAVVQAYAGSMYRLIISAAVLVVLFKKADLRDGAVIGCFCLAAVVQYVTSFVFINREK